MWVRERLELLQTLWRSDTTSKLNHRHKVKMDIIFIYSLFVTVLVTGLVVQVTLQPSSLKQLARPLWLRSPTACCRMSSGLQVTRHLTFMPTVMSILGLGVQGEMLYI